MDSVFGHPYDTPISVMKGLIDACGYPALLADTDGRILAYNAFAKTNISALETGKSIRSLMSAAEADALRTISVGETRHIQLKADVGLDAAAARLLNCFLISWRRPHASPEGSVFNPGYAVSGGLPPMPENGIAVFNSPSVAEVGMMAEANLRQQFFEIIEAVAGSAVPGVFDPSASARAICKAAENILGEDGPALNCSIDSSRALCSGFEEDYCRAVAAFIALAVRHCDTGRVFLKGALRGSNYVFSAGFGGLRFWTPPAAVEFGTAAALALLRRVAESDRWRISVRSDGVNRVRLSLTVPVGHSTTVIFMQPLPLERAMQIVKSQFYLMFPGT